MLWLALAAALLLAAPRQNDSVSSSVSSSVSPAVSAQQSDLTPQQKIEQARAKYEPTRQVAIHVNELAGNIHSEGDARAFIDAVAEQFSGHRHVGWTTRGIRHRVAHAEYEAATDPERLIPEQRIVDVWNEYVREIDAPEETLITAAEVHNLRDAMYTSSQAMWKKDGFTQTMWTMPAVYAVGADGKVAGGCRAVEAVKIVHDMFNFFPNVRGARERVQKGILVSDLVRQREQDATPRPQVVRSELRVFTNSSPLQSAELRYVQAHGQRDYNRLLMRLFEELFPKE